jgi:hypothetical protein
MTRRIGDPDWIDVGSWIAIVLGIAFLIFTTIRFWLGVLA